MGTQEESEPGLIDKLVGKKNKSPKDNDDADETSVGEADQNTKNVEADVADPETAAEKDEEVEELRHRIGELETTLTNASTSLEGLRGEQQTVAESLANLNDTNRRLLGIYDQVVSDANPFRDEEESRFGVFESLDDSEPESDAEVDVEATGEESTPEDDARDDDIEGPMERLGDDPTADEPAVEKSETVTTDPESVAETPANEHALTGEDANPVEASATEPVEGPAPAAPKRTFADLLAESDAEDGSPNAEATDDESEAVHRSTAEESAESGVTMTTVDDGYAPLSLGTVGTPQVATGTDPVLSALPNGIVADVLTMEWLGYLVSVGGVSRTLQALAFYERIGWLGRDARRDLERYLTGATEETAGDAEFEAGDHDRSYQHVARLALVDRIEPVLGSD